MWIALGTDKPTIKALHIHVKDEVALEWYDLGVQLLSEEHRKRLDIIRGDNPQVGGCCTEMFKCWLDVDPEASWNKLIEALKMIGKIALAEKIKRDVIKGVVGLYIYAFCTCM